MKEIPLIYQQSMVKSTMAGRKTNTRRLKGLQKINETPDDWAYWGHTKELNNGKWTVLCYSFHNKKTDELIHIKPQFGQKDDLLYVREAHAYIEDTSYDDYSSLGGWAYKADWKGDDEQKWKPSIHMPKRASRIWLRNTADPIPQRLQDISEADVIAEGIEPVGQNLEFGGVTYSGQWYKNYEKEGYSFLTPIDSFQSLICSIHGPEIWALNPYMWKIQFEVLSTTGKPENDFTKKEAK